MTIVRIPSGDQEITLSSFILSSINSNLYKSYISKFLSTCEIQYLTTQVRISTERILFSQTSGKIIMRAFQVFLFVAFSLLQVEAKAKLNIDTKRYARICQNRKPVADNDKRGHAIIKLAIESSSLTSILSKDSPQHKSMCWMIHDDPRKMDPRGNKARFLERYALVNLYTNTKGPGWTRSDLWLSKANVCDWYGIKCNQSLLNMGKPRVSSVDLSFNKVTGIIPAEIGYLTQVTEFDLNGNSLQGVLPQLMFQKMSKLKKLNLHMNDLFGAIPKEIGLLKNLKELTLFGNFFFGRVPASIENLKKLENLDLYANNLTGPVPTGIGKLKKLSKYFMFVVVP